MKNEFKNKLAEIRKKLFKARSKIEEMNVTDPHMPSRAEMKANAAKLPPKEKEEFPDSLLEPWMELCFWPVGIYGTWTKMLPRRWEIFTFVLFYPMYLGLFPQKK
tara:strand:- start:61 stop:375 length:315 start_codon:yes stop_codon:yes gene_type:complete